MDPKVNDSLTEAAAGSKALAATVAAFQGLLELLERAIQSAVGGHVPFDRLAIPDFRRHLEAAKAAYLHSAPAPQLLGANVLTPCAFTNSLDISTELGQWIASTNMFTNPTAQPMQLAGAPALPPAGHAPVGILHQLVYALQLDITMMQRLSGALKEIAERKAATVSPLQDSYYAQQQQHAPHTQPLQPLPPAHGQPTGAMWVPEIGAGVSSLLPQLVAVPADTNVQNFRAQMPQLTADTDPVRLLLARSASGGAGCDTRELDVAAGAAPGAGARPTGPRAAVAPFLRAFLPGGREGTQAQYIYLSPNGALQLGSTQPQHGSEYQVTAEKMILAYRKIAESYPVHQQGDFLQFGLTLIEKYWDVYPHDALLKFERAIRQRHLESQAPESFRYGAPSDHWEAFLTIVTPAAIKDECAKLARMALPQMAHQKKLSATAGGGGSHSTHNDGDGGSGSRGKRAGSPPRRETKKDKKGPEEIKLCRDWAAGKHCTAAASRVRGCAFGHLCSKCNETFPTQQAGGAGTCKYCSRGS